MKLKSRCFPILSVPYKELELAIRMEAKLFEKMPVLPLLPLVDAEDTLVRRTLENIPGIEFSQKDIVLKTGTDKYKQALNDLERTFNNPTIESLERYSINSAFFKKFEYLIHKFKSPNACINLLGPFSLSQILTKIAEDQMIADKSFRKLFVQAVCVKALWAIERMKKQYHSTVPIIILEEPFLAKLGDLKREKDDINSEMVTSLLAKVVEILKPTGALICIQCLEKCDWKVPIAAGVDILSFDAFNNPNNLCIIPDYVENFLKNGGFINWGIVPTLNESLVKKQTIVMVEKRLLQTFEGLVAAGVSRKLVYNNSLVSVNGSVEKLPLIFAEKAVMLSTQLAARIPVIKE